MPQHRETIDIDTISKQVIQPLSCDWIGCTAIINSWLTLQKVCKLYLNLSIGHNVCGIVINCY